MAVRRRHATTTPVDTGTVDSASGGRKGARKPTGYAGRISGDGRTGLTDQALGENNRSTGGKAAPGTGFGSAAGGGGLSGGNDLGQGTGGGVTESTSAPVSGDTIEQSYVSEYQQGNMMVPEAPLPARRTVEPLATRSSPSPSPTTAAPAPYSATTDARLNQGPRYNPPPRPAAGVVSHPKVAGTPLAAKSGAKKAPITSPKPPAISVSPSGSGAKNSSASGPRRDPVQKAPPKPKPISTTYTTKGNKRNR